MLTPAQYRTVKLVLGGASTGEAASQMSLSTGAVSNHLRGAEEREPSLGFVLAGAKSLHKRQKRAVAG